MRSLAFFLFAALVGACGARTTLDTGDGEENDAGRPIIDMLPPLDMTPPDGGIEFDIQCPRTVESRPGQRTTVTAQVLGDLVPTSERWEQLDGPAEVRLTPPTGRSTTFTPEVSGIYVLEFTAMDRLGRGGSCTTRVVATGSLPLLVCPDEQTVPVGETVTLEAEAFDEEGPVTLEWSFSGMGMATLEPSGATAAFTPFTATTYTIRVDGVDTDGNATSCQTLIRGIAPPEIDCPMMPFRAPTRQPFEIRLDVRDDTRVVESTWEGISWPDDDTGVEITETELTTATMIPRRQGRYEIRYTAIDTDGLASTCDVAVIGTPTPPTVTCPEEVLTPPLTPVDIEATAEDDGTIVSWQWTLESRAEGSGAAPPSPANMPSTTFTPDIVGVYELRVTATDDDGEVGTCTTTVGAVADEGLRIEMFWDTNGTDMDLHLLSPTADRWQTGQDCYYANCEDSPLPWGTASADDDPSLDIDDTNGFGPENINIDVPQDGTFRVGVHAFRGTGNVTVRIYCGGTTTEPFRTIGPVRVRDEALWKVADVGISGFSCTVDELLNDAGEPLVLTTPGRFSSR